MKTFTISRSVLVMFVIVLLVPVGPVPAMAQFPEKSTAGEETPDTEARADAQIFDLRTEVDVPLLFGAMGLWAMPLLWDRDQPSPACDRCMPKYVNHFDRLAIGFHNKQAVTASNVLVTAVPALAAAFSLADVKKWGWRGFIEDVILIAEAIAVSGMTHQFVRHIFQRPRPYMFSFDSDGNRIRDRNNAGDTHSFFSGHTAVAFAASTSFAYIFTIRRPNSKLLPLVWTVGMSVSATVGFLRVAGGQHFWSDIGAGALVGIGYGILIPTMHLRKDGARGLRSFPKVTITPGYLGVSGSF